MKMPGKISAGGIEWFVKLTDDVPLDADTCGLCDFLGKTIWLKKSDSSGRKLDRFRLMLCLAHEMAHASGGTEIDASRWEQCAAALMVNRLL